MSDDPTPEPSDAQQRLDAALAALHALRPGEAAALAGRHGELVVRTAEDDARDEHVKQVLLAIRNVNQLLVAEEDPDRLCRQACHILTETLGYHAVWLARTDPDGTRVLAFDSAGLGDLAAELAQRLGAAGGLTPCIREALAGSGEAIVLDPAAVCDDCPLRVAYGARASLTRRLSHSGQLYGVLTVSIPRSYATNPEEHALFEELAGDLAFALHKIETARRHRETAADLTRAEALAMVGAWRFDLQTGQVTAPESTRRIYGVGASELTIEDVQRIPLPNYRPALDAALRALVEDGAPYDVEFQIQRPSDGAIRHIHSVAEYDPQRRVIYGTLQDVTAWRLAELRARNREQYLETILQSSVDGFWVLDGQGRMIEANAAYSRMSGYDPADLIGLRIQDLDAIEGASQVADRISRITARGSELFETVHRRKDGSLWPVEVSVTYLPEDGGRFVCFSRDLSERQERDERIALLGQMLDAAPAAITIHDQAGQFLFANHAACAMHGYHSEEEFMAVQLDELDVPESAELIAARMRRIEAHGEARFEVEHRRRDGTTFPLEVHVKAIVWDGRPAMLSVATDITERKQAERALQESERHYRQLVSTASDAIYLLDNGGRVMRSNEAAARMLGRSLEELESLTIDAIDPAVQDLGGIEAVWRDVPPGEPLVFETMHLRRDGTKIPVEVSGTKFCSGESTYYLGIARDIRDRRAVEEALRDSEERQRAVIAASPMAIITLDLDGRVQSWNPAAEEIFGWTEAEVLGQQVPIVPDWDSTSSQAMREAVLAGRSFSQIELTRQRRDGSVVEVSLSTAPICDSSGRAVALVGLFEDITARKEAETALRASEAYIRSMFRVAPVGIGLVRDRMIATVNERICQMTGYAAEELLGQSSRVLYPSDADFEFVGREKYAQIAAHGVGQVETRWRTKDGRVIDVLLASTPLDPADLDRGVMFTALDMTDRKQAEAALLRERIKQDKMLANTGDVIVIIDAEGINRYKSPNVERWFGWRPEELLGQPALSLVHPEDVPHAAAFLLGLMQTPRSTASTEVRYRCQDGTYRWIEFTGTNLADDPEVSGILGNYHDISERKAAAEESAQLQRQLAQAQRLESVGRLAGGVAHDFNNMLNVILGYADLLQQDLPADSPWSEGVAEIRAAALRSADLTRQLLAFARRQTVSPRILDVNETVEAMLKMLRRLIGEDIELVWRPGAPLAPLLMDPAQLDQVLANLVVNARDAIDGVGRITITTARAVFGPSGGPSGVPPGEYVALAVHDTGCGMDAETQSMIFEPFFTTKGHGQGTGLGLATVFGIVSQNLGTIEVASAPGEGTTFRMYFPASREAAQQQPQAETPQVIGGEETILLVEDELAILHLCARLLRRAGYAVLTAASPTEGLAVAAAHQGEIDLLISDVIMPEMNGRDLAGLLLAGHPEMKCLFMSGYTADVIAPHGMLAEGVQFIQKPFAANDLVMKAREVLDQR